MVCNCGTSWTFLLLFFFYMLILLTYEVPQQSRQASIRYFCAYCFQGQTFVFFTVLCQELLPLNDGTLEVSTNGVASVVKRSCDIGFSLNGSERSTCYENGTWDISTIIKCGRCRN